MGKHRDEQTLCHYRKWWAAAVAFYPQLKLLLRQGQRQNITVAVSNLIGTYADGTNITWQLRESMQWARSQDAHCLKELAGSLVSQALDTQFVLSRDTKLDRGFNHQAIGRLLVPVHILKAYGTDPVGWVHI